MGKKLTPEYDATTCFASLDLVKQLFETMAYHVQEANKTALELCRYAIPKHTHELERWSTDKTGNRVKDENGEPLQGNT